MKYVYEEWVYAALQRVVRGLFRPGIPLRRASLDEDLGGIDAQYIVEQTCPLALRARFNRPPGAGDSDVTFRTTEPSMMTAGTYAPLALFVWFVGREIVQGRLIDIERMSKRIQPTLGERVITRNGDGTGFHCVTIGELHDARALLRTYDGNVWATEILGGEARLNQILSRYNRRTA